MAETIGASISKGFEMPKRQYMEFDGNPMNYPRFLQNFKTNVEMVESDPNARRQYLIQLCTGNAKEAISGTVMLPPEEGYFKARSILHELFGQTHIIAAAHIDRVTKGGIIKEFESGKLMQLALELEDCQMNLSQLGYQSDINSRSNICAVILRLPRYLRSEWAREAQNLRCEGREPDFSSLTRFVVKKAKLANTEYGLLINAKGDGEKGRPAKSQRNALVRLARSPISPLKQRAKTSQTPVQVRLTSLRPLSAYSAARGGTHLRNATSLPTRPTVNANNLSRKRGCVTCVWGKDIMQISVNAMDHA